MDKTVSNMDLAVSSKTSKFNLLKRFKEKRQLKKELAISSEIKQKLSNSKNIRINFGVDNDIRWKAEVYYKLLEDPKKEAYFMLADIDGLKAANDAHKGEEIIVDKQIKAILDDIKGVFEQTNPNIKTYMSKPPFGDEIRILVENATKEEMEQINEQVNSLRQKDIGVSSGYSFNQGQGLEQMLEEADAEMFIHKNQKHIKHMRDAFGISEKEKNELGQQTIEERVDEYKNFLEEEVKTIISKVRLDLNDLNQERRGRLKETFFESLTVAQKEKNEVMSNVFQKETKKDVVFERIKQIEQEMQKKYGNIQLTQEQLQDLVIKELLSQHQIVGLRREYFDEIYYKKHDLEKRLGNRLDKFVQMDIDISGIKDANDIVGHSETDRQIQKTMEDVLGIAKEKGIDIRLIIGDGIGRYNIVAGKEKEEVLQDVLTEIQNIKTVLRVSATYSPLQHAEEYKKTLKLGKNNENINYKRVINETAEYNNITLKEQAIEKKLKPSQYMIRQMKQFSETVEFNEYKKLVKKTDKEVMYSLLDSIYQENEQGKVKGKEHEVQKEDTLKSEGQEYRD